MQLFVTILHIVLSVLMILIILLQPGKEGGAALAGGSSGNQMYGPRGAGNLLGRATTVVAAMFMLTSITLAWYSSERIQSGSNIEDAIERLEGANDDVGFGLPTAPASTPDVQAPVEPAPTDAQPSSEGDAAPSEEGASTEEAAPSEEDKNTPVGVPAQEADAQDAEDASGEASGPE